MLVSVLASGSKGNSTLVSFKNINILIDAGINAKEVKKRLNNVDLKIDYIFITHSHDDHIKGLKSIVKEFNPIVYSRNEIFVLSIILINHLF